MLGGQGSLQLKYGSSGLSYTDSISFTSLVSEPHEPQRSAYLGLEVLGDPALERVEAGVRHRSSLEPQVYAEAFSSKNDGLSLRFAWFFNT